MILWIVGKSLPGENDWEFAGVFSTEDKAKEACLTEDYFIGPHELDELDTIDESNSWNGAYYPLLEE